VLREGERGELVAFNECFGGGNSACCGNTAMGTVPTFKEWAEFLLTRNS
jgi:hypothetical protein